METELENMMLRESFATSFRVYKAYGRPLVPVKDFDTRKEALAYCRKHKKDSLWIMDIEKATMQHNSHFA